MSNPLSGKNILVVEDEVVFSSLICGFVESMGGKLCLPAMEKWHLT